MLLQSLPPWGGTHRDLVTIYRDSADGECPLITDKDEVPSCGTKPSRFGCWTCTVFEKDRCAEAFVGAGYDNLEPPLEMHDRLKALREDNTRRSARRRNDNLNFVGDVRLIPGPLTIKARREILDRLLSTQAEVGPQLISGDEIEAIRQLWLEDSLAAESRG